MLSGSLNAMRSGAGLNLREESGPGDALRWGMGESLVVEASEETWLLCHHRGALPASYPLFLVPTALSPVLVNI